MSKKAQETTIVIPEYVADIETANDMFGQAKMDGLELSKDLKGNELPCLKYSFENKDGEKVTGTITDKATIGAIQRIRVAGKVSTASTLVIASNLGYLITEKKAFKSYNVTSAQKLSDLLGLGLSPEMAMKCAKVGKAFLTVDENGYPMYKDGIPHLPVSSLDYLATFVDYDKETGKANYDRLADFIQENGITDRTSQATIKKLLPKKETGKKETGKKETSGTAINADTRGGKLEQAIESLETIVTYLVNFADVDDDTEIAIADAVATIRRVLDFEKVHRDEDLQNPEASVKWTDKI